MVWESPKAIHFVAYADGLLLPWNSEFGLKVRWRAANLATSVSREDLEAAAKLATEQIQEELGNQSVVVEVA